MAWIEQGTCNQRPGEQIVAIEQEGFGIVCAVLDYEGESVHRILRAVNAYDALFEACRQLVWKLSHNGGNGPVTIDRNDIVARMAAEAIAALED